MRATPTNRTPHRSGSQDAKFGEQEELAAEAMEGEASCRPRQVLSGWFGDKITYYTDIRKVFTVYTETFYG